MRPRLRKSVDDKLSRGCPGLPNREQSGRPLFLVGLVGGVEMEVRVECVGRVDEPVGGVLAEAFDPLGDVRRERGDGGWGDLPALARRAGAGPSVMSRAVWKITQLASSVLNLMIFSCSAGSLRSIVSCPNRSQAENSL